MTAALAVAAFCCLVYAAVFAADWAMRNRRVQGALWRLRTRLALWRSRRHSSAPDKHAVWLKNRGKL